MTVTTPLVLKLHLPTESPSDADNPDDVATFNAVKDALEAYEPTRTEAQVSVLKKLNEAGLTPEELVVANGITTADVTKYAATAEASTKPAKRGRKK